MAGHEQIPPDLYRRRRADRSYRMLGALITGYERLSRYSWRRRPPVVAVNRDLHLVVDEVRQQADEVVSLRLVHPRGHTLPAWQPGAHLDVVLPSGRMRQYSLCGDPTDRHSYRIAVRRLADGDGGSVEVHDTLQAGSGVTVRGPRNAFPFVTTERYLFLAGGIGITPILPMVRTAAARGVDWHFVYAGRSRESMPFLDEIAQLDPHRVWIRPDTHYGIPASGAELLEHAPEGATVYCCGPAPMITGVRLDLPASRAEALHFERFSAPPIVNGTPFHIDLAHSGHSLQVPADRSALSVIREHVPEVAYSCRQGFCGTCKTRVLAGEVEHRDHVLTDTERAENMMICVSRATSQHLKLDL
ncbi:PDR/VanB family oxidoreductase [Halopolyspora algeriensis]